MLTGPALIWLVRSNPIGMWRQLSIVTGLLALSALVCTACLPSRLRNLTRTFGIENILGLHRQLGVLCAVLIALHLAAVVAANPTQVALLMFPTAPNRARAAVGATLALAGLLTLALQRRRLKIAYEVWRWLHLLLAISTLGLSALHVLWLKHLVTDAVLGPVLTGLGLLMIAVLVARWLGRTMRTSEEFVVEQVRRENPTVATLVLSPRRRRGRGFVFSPGQFAWIRLQRSAVEEHPFTIASSAHLDTTEFTIRHAGDFTRALRHLPPGSPVWVDGPHGAFTNDVGTGAGFVMIAGGVGVTPMMSMLRTAADRCDPRPYRLVVVASSPEDLLFRDELADLRRHLNLVVTEVLRRPHDGWYGHTGEIGVGLLSMVLAGAAHPAEIDYFICGPSSLVTDALSVLDVLGAAPARVHTEQFDFV